MPALSHTHPLPFLPLPLALPITFTLKRSDPPFLFRPIHAPLRVHSCRPHQRHILLTLYQCVLSSYLTSPYFHTPPIFLNPPASILLLPMHSKGEPLCTCPSFTHDVTDPTPSSLAPSTPLPPPAHHCIEHAPHVHVPRPRPARGGLASRGFVPALPLPRYPSPLHCHSPPPASVSLETCYPIGRAELGSTGVSGGDSYCCK
jgi:hypothetical protein